MRIKTYREIIRGVASVGGSVVAVLMLPDLVNLGERSEIHQRAELQSALLASGTLPSNAVTILHYQYNASNPVPPVFDSAQYADPNKNVCVYDESLTVIGWIDPFGQFNFSPGQCSPPTDSTGANPTSPTGGFAG